MTVILAKRDIHIHSFNMGGAHRRRYRTSNRIDQLDWNAISLAWFVETRWILLRPATIKSVMFSHSFPTTKKTGSLN